MIRVSNLAYLAALILLAGKVSGFIKDLFLTYFIGISAVSDAYFMAMNLAGLANAPFLAAAPLLLVPAYGRFYNRVPDASKVVVGALIGVLALASAVAIFVGVQADVLVRLFYSDAPEEARHLAKDYVAIMAFSFPVSVLVVSFSSLQTVNDRVLLSYSLPLFNNLAFCTSIFFFNSSSNFQYVVWAGVASWLVLFIVSVHSSRKIIANVFADFATMGYKATLSLKSTVSLVLLSVLEQATAVVPILIASTLGAGAVSYISYTSKLTLLVCSLSVLLITTRVFPILARTIEVDSLRNTSEYCNKVIKVMVLISVGIATLFVTWSHELITLIYFRGEFSSNDVSQVAGLLEVMAFAIPLIVLRDFLTRLLICLDMKREVVTAMLVNILVLVTICLLAAKGAGLVGIAFGIVFSALISVLYSLLMLTVKANINFTKSMKASVLFILGFGVLAAASTTARLIHRLDNSFVIEVSVYVVGFILSLIACRYLIFQVFSGQKV